LKTLVREAWIRLPGCLLGSRVLMWLVLGMILGAASAFLCFVLDAKPPHMMADVNGLP
jgi:hypothetical protein